MREALKRAGVEPRELSDVIFGDCIRVPDEANAQDRGPGDRDAS